MEKEHLGDAQDVMLNSGTFLDSAYYSPESVLPPAFLLQHSEPEKSEGKIPKTIRKRIEIDDDEKTPSRSSPIGLIASLSVGILVAVFLFPVIRFAERGTRSFMTESFTGEIGRRVDQYEQINANRNTDQIEEMLPINLALSGWKEVPSDILASHEYFDTPTDLLENAFPAARFSENGILNFQPPLWTDTEDWEELTPLDMLSLSDRMLLVILGQESAARSAFGKDILLKDGRVFFRDLR